MNAVATISIADMIARRNEIVRAGEYNERSRAGGYVELGRLIELRHERAEGANTPSRELTDYAGLTMDWKHFHNGPRIARDLTRTQLLVIPPVPPLPDLPAPNYAQKFVTIEGNRVPLASVPQEMREKHGITEKDDRRPMIKQRFAEHSCGTFENWLVFGPLTQALYKIDGIVGMALIRFATPIHSADSPMFFLDPATGEAHFLGGQFFLE